MGGRSSAKLAGGAMSPNSGGGIATPPMVSASTPVCSVSTKSAEESKKEGGRKEEVSGRMESGV